jgi:hypothetical protein
LVQIQPNPAFAREKRGFFTFLKELARGLQLFQSVGGGWLLISVDSPSTQGILP